MKGVAAAVRCFQMPGHRVTIACGAARCPDATRGPPGSFHATAPAPGRSDWCSVIRHEHLGTMSGDAFGQYLSYLSVSYINSKVLAALAPSVARDSCELSPGLELPGAPKLRGLDDPRSDQGREGERSARAQFQSIIKPSSAESTPGSTASIIRPRFQELAGRLMEASYVAIFVLARYDRAMQSQHTRIRGTSGEAVADPVMVTLTVSNDARINIERCASSWARCVLGRSSSPMCICPPNQRRRARDAVLAPVHAGRTESKPSALLRSSRGQLQ